MLLIPNEFKNEIPRAFLHHDCETNHHHDAFLATLHEA